MLEELFAFLLEHEQLVDHVLDSPSESVLLDALSEVIARDMKQAIEADPSVMEKLDVPAATLANFMSGGTVKLLRSWWNEGKTEEGADDILRMVNVAGIVEHMGGPERGGSGEVGPGKDGSSRRGSVGSDRTMR